MPRTEASRPPHRRSEVLRFAGRFLVLFAAAAVLWTFLTPAYNRTVAGAAGGLFRLVERSNVTSVRAEGGNLWIDRATEEGPQPFNYFDPYLYFAVVPLVALVLATPRLGAARRAKRLVLGMAGLFLLHLTYVVGSVELAYVAMGLSPVGLAAGRVLDWAQVLLRLVWEAAPLALFVGLTVRDWRAWARAEPASGRTKEDVKRKEGPSTGQGVVQEGARP